MTRKELKKLRALIEDFDVKARKNYLRADATMDEGSDACERVGWAFNYCASALEVFTNNARGQQ